jgi:hypothetical protein
MEQTTTNNNASAPQQIHISLIGNNSYAIMWVSFEEYVEPICQFHVPKPDCIDEQNYFETLNGTVYPFTEVAATAQKLKNWGAICYCSKLMNLIPDCSYQYRVGDKKNDNWSKDFTFKTTPKTPFPTTIVTFSDFDTMNEIIKEKSTMNRLYSNLSEFDLILEYGDICYADGNSRIWDLFFTHIEPIASTKPWMVAVGNHEKEGELGFDAFENRFCMPGKKFWYSFNYGYAHYIAISTEHPIDEGTEQYKWFVSDLKLANRNRQLVPWIIVTGHRALYGSNKRWFLKEKAKKLRQILVPLFDKYSVDLCLFGHCHSYERTHPLKAGEIDQSGTVYLVAGVAGAKLDKEWFPQPQWSAYRTAHHGYGLLHIKDEKKLRFCYHREKDGLLWDAFTIKKKRNGFKKEITYDYENKFLSRWYNIPVDPKKVLKTRKKMEERGYLHLFDEKKDKSNEIKVGIEEEQGNIIMKISSPTLINKLNEIKNKE